MLLAESYSPYVALHTRDLKIHESSHITASEFEMWLFRPLFPRCLLVHQGEVTRRLW